MIALSHELGLPMSAGYRPHLLAPSTSFFFYNRFAQIRRLAQGCHVSGTELNVREFTLSFVANGILASCDSLDGMAQEKERCGMYKLGEVRSLLAHALRTANELNDNAPPELEDGLAQINALLHSAVERMDEVTAPDPLWPGLAARA
jgi:hypothetical protein